MKRTQMRPSRKLLELPLLKSLVEAGGAAVPDEKLYRSVADKAAIGRDWEYDIVHARPKWVYDLQWVRHVLMKQGQLDGSVRGLWQITELGRQRVAHEWAAYAHTRVAPAEAPRECRAVSADDVEAWVADYYESRVTRVRKVRIEQLLPLMNPYALYLESVHAAPDVIELALDVYLSLSEDSIFGAMSGERQPGAADWRALTGDPACGEDVLKLIQKCPLSTLSHYRNERSNSVNRLISHFMADFVTDGSIDWEKLVRFNSGAKSGKR